MGNKKNKSIELFGLNKIPDHILNKQTSSRTWTTRVIHIGT